MGGQRHGRKRYNRIPKVPPADDQHSNGQAEVIHLQSPKLNNSFQAMPVPSSMKSNQLTRTYSEDSISEDKINEAIEDTFMEYIQYQTEKIHDIIDDLDQLNKSSWSNTANLGDGITKLTVLKEKLIEIKSRSLDLPDFWDRRPLKDYADYTYIKRILEAWNESQDKLEIARKIVYSLPIVQIHGGKNNQVTSTSRSVQVAAASMTTEQKKKNFQMEKELQERLERILSLPKRSESVVQTKTTGQKPMPPSPPRSSSTRVYDVPSGPKLPTLRNFTDY